MMDMVKRILAAFLVLTAIAVALNLILTPVYHDGSPDYPVWKIVNWFMAVAVFVALVVSYLQRRTLGSEGAGNLQYIRASLTYYGAIVLTMLFFWGWFWTLNPDSETGDAITAHIIYFPIMDSLFVVVALAAGCRLWNHGGDSKE